MNKGKIVVALGGNALGDTPTEQLIAVRQAAGIIADLAQDGYKIVVGHGNGPQIGMINLAMNDSAANGKNTPYMPLAECGAMSQGYIGYHLQLALTECFSARSISRNVVCLITEVLVDENDPSFQTPRKPIGKFYSLEAARKLEEERGFRFMEDAGRGYRRVVPSPQPKKIMELSVINRMAEEGDVVITVGGGGIPVVKNGSHLQGIDAVIDKDKSCSRLAQDLGADVLLILTAVDQVYLNYNKPDQKALLQVSGQEVRRYIRDGQFATGSMLPKMEACLAFVDVHPNCIAIITSISSAKNALLGLAGTRIVN